MLRSMENNQPSKSSTMNQLYFSHQTLREEAKALKDIFNEKKKVLKIENQKLTQQRLGELMNFDSPQSTVSQYMNGIIPLNLDAALKFSSLLKCEVADFSTRLAKAIQQNKNLESAIRESTATYSTNTSLAPVIPIDETITYMHGDEREAKYLPKPPNNFKGFYVEVTNNLMMSDDKNSITKGFFAAVDTNKTKLANEKTFLISTPKYPQPIIRRASTIDGLWEFSATNDPLNRHTIEFNPETDRIIGQISGTVSYLS